MGGQGLTTGTKEWAEVNCNFQKGCRNNCVYCYAKATAIRFCTNTPEGWENPTISMPEHYPYGKLVMLPSSHDIDNRNVAAAEECIRELLKRDNRILIVTKPNPSTIGTLIRFLEKEGGRGYRERVSFRLTMGTADDGMIQKFEPGAPTFHERFMALRDLYIAKIPASVSAEPLIGGIDTFDDLYLRVRKFMTGQIWVGRMNMPRQRIRMNTGGTFDEKLIDWVVRKQSDEEMLRLYDRYGDDPKVAFKDSISSIIGRWKGENEKDEC